MDERPNHRLQEELKKGNIIPFIGVYDVFSASIAAKYYDGIFISGFGFAASFYGLPDIGFIAWSDITSFVQRVRAVLPKHHILVDIDDGYADTEVACHVVSLLEATGATGVVIEDQKRPRQCGHFDNKQIMELDGFIEKLSKVLATRRDLFVIARTDATDVDEILKRARAFANAGADAILVDAIRDLDLIKRLKSQVQKPLVFNQIAGGKSPHCSLTELRDLGISIVIYSTPCLFPAQEAIESAMIALRENDGLLHRSAPEKVDVKTCTALLNKNLARREEK
jgi:2-methylisocitrate lyase-like PEP mutase family enzyme